MFFSNLMLAAGSAALLFSANASPTGEEFGTTDLVARAPPGCVDSSLSENKELSTYNFTVTIESNAPEAALNAGFTHVGVWQDCKVDPSFGASVSFAKGTENWGTLPLNLFDPYRLVLNVKRCKKGFGKYVKNYRVQLCTSADKTTCVPICGEKRERCAANGGEKAVVIEDPTTWTCVLPQNPAPPG